MKPVHYNRLNLKNLITVTPRICHNSTGVTREYSFQCIYPSIIIELTQVVPIEEGKPMGRLLVRLLVLGLLCKHLLSLALDVLVALEGAHERMILLVRDFGVDVCVVLYLAQAFLVLKEVDRRLQSYVQFCQYFV